MDKNKEGIIEEKYLKNYREFVNIDNDNYGGKQKWLYEEGKLTKYQADRSCGLIAAVNTMIYMYGKNKLMEKEDYINHVLSLHKYLKPRIYGLPTVSVMVKGLNKYAENINLNLAHFILENPSSKLRTIEYIKEGLEKNSPIMMLTWNSNIKNLRFHWVTITGYFLTELGESYIVTSNWGRKEIFSLDKWFDEKVFYKALLYSTGAFENE